MKIQIPILLIVILNIPFFLNFKQKYFAKISVFVT